MTDTKTGTSSFPSLEILTSCRDARGQRLEIHKLHQPGPLRITAEEAEGVDRIEGTLPRRAGDRLAASYVNFYLANGGLILPTFGEGRDVEAAALLAALCPERRIVPVPPREILLGGGNIPCPTQQQPAGEPHAVPKPPPAAAH